MRVIRGQEEIDSGGAHHAYGPVQVVSQFSSYRQVKLHTHETLGVGPIDLPEQVLETDAWWLAFGDELLEPLRAEVERRAHIPEPAYEGRVPTSARSSNSSDSAPRLIRFP